MPVDAEVRAPAQKRAGRDGIVERWEGGWLESARATYGGCFYVDVSKCMTGCASPNWYFTDTGALTPMSTSLAQSLKYVTVGCVKGICTTDALPKDAAVE